MVTVPATEPTKDDYVNSSRGTQHRTVLERRTTQVTLHTWVERDVETLYAQWTEQALTIVVPETSVPETTDVPTPSDVTLPATGSSGGTVNPVCVGSWWAFDVVWQASNA